MRPSGAGARTDSSTTDRDRRTAAAAADPVALKLVRVDRTLRAVAPVAPPNIRRTGVATPAIQALQNRANQGLF